MDVEFLKYHCSVGVMVAWGEHRGVYTIGAALDSRSGVSVIEEAGVRRLQQYFRESRVAYLCNGMQKVAVAVGHGESITQHVF